MPTLKLSKLPERPSRLAVIDHRETLAMLDPEFGDFVIRNDTHVFKRQSLFLMPAAWSGRSKAQLAQQLDQALQAIYATIRTNALEDGRQTGDYNHQALLDASGRVLDLAELEPQPWKTIFRLYILSEHGEPRFVSAQEFEAGLE
jgi:hypothetical protein